MELETILDSVVVKLETLDQTRELVLQKSRKLNRISGKAISLLLQNTEVNEHIDNGKILLDEINMHMAKLGSYLSWNSISNGIEEYSELLILNSIIRKIPIKNPEESGIPTGLWLTSLCDVAGELRRIVLKALIDGQIEDAKNYYNRMNEISLYLRGLTFSKNLVPNLRRKLDILRAITEKTDSDMTNALLTLNKMNKS